jgi:glycosyltransferase involved in cell wall biosynthesis
MSGTARGPGSEAALATAPGREEMAVREGREARGSEDCRTVAVIPAYNEERFIGSVVLGARRYADRVIVVDDGSTDATAEVAEAAGALVARHGENRGKGVALNTGFRLAAELCPEAVVMLDADGQHRPDEIQQVLEPVLAGEADIAVGSRYVEEGNAIPPHRVWGHHVFAALTSALTGVRVCDSQCGFRAFSRAAVDVICFCSDGFSVESEMQFLAREHGLKLVETPISAVYADRPKRSVVAHGLMVVGGIVRLVGQYRPLLYFGLSGALALLVGLGWGVVVVERFRQTGQLAVGYTLLCVLLALTGVILTSTGIMLHSIRALLLGLLKDRRGR